MGLLKFSFNIIIGIISIIIIDNTFKKYNKILNKISEDKKKYIYNFAIIFLTSLVYFII